MAEPNRTEDEPQEKVSDGPRLRDVSPEVLKGVLRAHREWAETGGKQGHRADLSHANLQNADLSSANLQGANLEGACLKSSILRYAELQDVKIAEPQDGEVAHHTIKTRLKGAKLQGADLTEAKLAGAILKKADLYKANLDGADLQGANLYKANLREVDFKGATLQEADLRRATLRNADLQDANLEGARSFLSEQLAGANVSGAKLPDDIAKFEGLAHVEETSRNARKIFLATLLGCVYSWLTIATTTDARLLTNTASSPLPIIRTEVPIAGFYWAAPLILLSLYFYLHFYLQRLWRALAALPAVFPDGKALDERAYPWLLNGLVRAHLKRLKGDRPPLSRSENILSTLLAWWVVPFTLVLFWGRYLPRHEWAVTALHVALLVVSVGAAMLLYRLAGRTLRGDEGKTFRWKKPWLDARIYQGAPALAIGAIFALVSLGAIEGTPCHAFEGPCAKRIRTWVPATFEFIGYRAFANLREAHVSTRPENWWMAASREDKLEAVEGASLQDSDLRYADAVRAFLVKADLRDANLQGASLFRSKLQRANLNRADLQGANLSLANLQEADLRFANLQEADLFGAGLQGAGLLDANLQGAYLTKARNLTQEQLDEACGDDGTKLPKGLTIKPCPEEQGAE